jgi:hypothetical protein
MSKLLMGKIRNWFRYKPGIYCLLLVLVGKKFGHVEKRLHETSYRMALRKRLTRRSSKR